MKRSPYFSLIKIGTENYLIPFGQEIENIRPPLRMNGASSFLWEKFSEHTDEKDLVLALAREYDVPQEELSEIGKDVRLMLRQLMSAGAVINDFPEKAGDSEQSRMSVFSLDAWKALRSGEPRYRDLMIGGLLIRLYGSDDYFSDQFNDFYMRKETKGSLALKEQVNSENEKQDACGPYSGSEAELGFEYESETSSENEQLHDRAADIEIIVTEEVPSEAEGLPVLIKGLTVTVMDGGDFYLIRSMEAPAIREGHILKDGSRAVLFMTADGEETGKDPAQERAKTVDFSKTALFGKKTETYHEHESTPADMVFHMIRHVFMICAEKRDMYIIHSASILYNGRAWLFSALSGIGKSTHTNIWHKLYGTPYLDGDLNLLTFENGRPVVKGIPWCGTSGIYTTETWPLGGIVLLARDSENYVEELSLDQKVLGISMRFISPKWDEELIKGVLDFSERIAKSSGICRLHCNMEDEAAEVCRRWIDDAEK